MRYSTVLPLILITLFFSCKGQRSADKPRNTQIGNSPALSIGDTLAEMADELIVVYQDMKNNYWFCGNGVYMYDGKNIIHFTIEDGLCSNHILRIQEDKTGNIYFDGGECVSKFDGLSFTTVPTAKKESSRNEWKLKVNDLWFRGTWQKNGVYRLEGDSLYHLEFPMNKLAEEFYANYPNASYSPYGIYSMYKDHKGTMWFGTSDLGIYRFDGKSISWMYEEQLTKIGEGVFGIRAMIQDKGEDFWFCNMRYRYEMLPNDSIENGTHFINYKRKSGMGSSADLENDLPYFMSIVEDDLGDLWMSTFDEGVWHYDGQTLTHYPIREAGEQINIFSIYKDRQGAIWLGTQKAGVYKFTGEAFERFTP